jgi:DNA-binding NarL/FixJ family response regulator
MDMGDLRVLVVGDGTTLAQDLRLVLGRRAGIRVSEPVSEAKAALAAVLAGRADLVVVDLDHDPQGLPTISRLRDGAPRVRILAAGGAFDEAAAAAVLSAGGCGLLPRSYEPQVLTEAFRRAVDGGAVLPDLPADLPAAALGRLPVSAHTAPAEDPFASLTPRELEVLELLASGRSTHEVAATLGISATTVQSHVKNLLAKLGVHSKVEAVRLAWRSGVVATPVGA